MAKLKMQRITLYALRKDRKKILDDIQRMGVIEVSDTLDADCVEDDVFFKDSNTTMLGLLEKNNNLINQALSIIDSYFPEKKGLFASLEAKKHITAAQFDERELSCEKAVEGAGRITELNKKIAELTTAKLKTANSMEALTPWLNLDVPTSFAATKSTKAFIGSFPEEYDVMGVYTLLASADADLGAFDVSVISSDKKQTCVFILCSKKEAEAMDNALRMCGFVRPTTYYERTPMEEKEALKAQILQIETEIDEIKSDISELTSLREDLQFASDYCSISREKYEAADKMLESKNTFVLSGYLIKEKAAYLEQYLNEKYAAVMDFEDVSGDDVPVALRNNALSAPCESVLESFSMPAQREVDPTSIMSIFYYIFFGLMLADAIYGLLMFLGCFLVLRKYREMGAGTKKMLQMFMYCGITTAFWGVMFGSYCGNAIDTIALVMFNKVVTVPALWFVPVNEPMRMLVYSFAFGIVHLLTGLLIGGYQQLKEGDVKGFIYDTVFWIGLVVSLIMLLLPTDIFASIAGTSFTFAPIVTMASEIVAGICALGIILTAGRESRNWFKRILKGLYGLYNISGWLSDILSYSRLLALGLASGVIATVINEMASMVAGGIIGKVIFLVIFVAGHVLNIAINLLGAYVHTNRLQFVEFFGKFYEGGGQKFEPLANKTKYYTIQEETN